MRIDFKKPQNTLKKDESKKESLTESNEKSIDSQEVIYDKSGHPITKPELIAEVKRIQALPIKKTKEKMRLYTILKNGDNTKNQTATKAKRINGLQTNTAEIIKLIPKPKIKTKQPKSNTQTNSTEELIKNIIADIYEGLDPVSACKKNSMSYRELTNKLNDPSFSKLKDEFNCARAAIADNYIYKVNLLQEKLLSGDVDYSTYQAISRDLIYLAGKFAPTAFGDKISIEKSQKIEVSHSVDQSKIASLNKLLALPSSEIEAEFEEV